MRFHHMPVVTFAIFLTQPDDFVLDPDWMEECEVATLSEMLKKVFGGSARMATGDGIVELME